MIGRINMRWESGQIWDEMRDKYKMEVQCEDWSPVAVSSGGRERNSKLRPTPSLPPPCFLLLFHFPALFCSRNTLSPSETEEDVYHYFLDAILIWVGSLIGTRATLGMVKSSEMIGVVMYFGKAKVTQFHWWKRIKLDEIYETILKCIWGNVSVSK